jgi:SNF2 family DNA or RNA helicase
MLKSALQRIHEIFPPAVLMRGQEYQRNGHVLQVRLSDGLVRARVKGSSNQLYDVYIDLKTWPKQASQCTCTYIRQCKHAVAALYALKAKEQGDYPSKSSEPQDDIYTPWRESILDAESMEWYSSTNATENDFFSYELGILIDNKPFSIVPLVSELLTRLDETSLNEMSDDLLMKLPLADGKYLQIRLARIKPLLHLLVHYLEKQAQGGLQLNINRYQLLLMREAELALAATSARWQGTELLQAQLRSLSERGQLPAVLPPSGLQTILRDYQQQGLNWLQYLRETAFAGVLADDMGLGKTVQTLAHLLLEKEAGRQKATSLIVAPTSVLWNWYDEAQRFTPALKVKVFHGASRHVDDFADYDVVISSYGLIQRDKTRFLNYKFYYVILDEAQCIKNSRTKTTLIIQQLQAHYRLCLTGTPLENHLGELWSLFHFLMPGLLGDAKQFRRLFRVPIEKEGSDEIREHLVRRIRPFMLRRTKTQVEKELPAKTEMIHTLELTGPQRDLYEAIRLSMEKRVRDAIVKQGMGRSHLLFLDALLKLRQICCDPRLLSLPEASLAHGTSVKLNSLMDLLDNLMEEGRSVLVFSQFTSMLKLIEERLQSKHYRYLKLTGQSQNRQDIVQAFQAGEAPIFLISLKAGGVGLNLTRADTVIHYDPWWNPAVEDQATDRSHRIGQQQPVFVYKLITAGTVEEAMLRMQDRKRQLFEGILSSHASPTELFSEKDIAMFFAPLEKN